MGPYDWVTVVVTSVPVCLRTRPEEGRFDSRLQLSRGVGMVGLPLCHSGGPAFDNDAL